MLRLPAVVGRFYPQDARELERQVASFCVAPAAEPRRRAIACMVPHAGYRFSGHVAGAVYARLELPRRFLLLGPRHYPRGKPQAILCEGPWETPLGRAEIDTELAHELMRACPALSEDEVAHRDEHALEVQLPFLQSLAGDFRFVPIALGTIDFDELESLGRAIAGLLARQTVPVLLVASSDMNQTLLSYWLAPERSFLWVVTPGQVATFTLPRQSEIESLVAAYNESIEGLRDPARENGETGRKLYDVLLSPACAFIRPGSNVIIVPDGALHNLNFESLPVTGAEPHYWIDDVSVAIVPSLDLAYRHTARLRNRASGAYRFDQANLLLVFGDPAPPSDTNLPRLPNATLEIHGIQQQFHQAKVLTGLAAAPDAYAASKPERFSMIHFAAHAEANHEDPLDSAIILSPQGDSYKLYARDVVRLPIRAKLVTISACRSAGGRAYAGEGLVGFAWAFLQAGARNVVAGLWEVDDRSTAELMKAMYSELRSGKNPQQSLRAAKLSLLRSGGSYRKPYYWAPFQLITDSLIQ